MKKACGAFFLITLIVVSIVCAKKFDHPLKNQTYLDKNGLLIGTLNTLNGGYGQWTPYKDLPQNFTRATLQKEDRYFYYHPGINPFAIIRAFFTNIRSSKTYGGSTITQQLAKNLIQIHQGSFLKRTLFNKIYEAFTALGLEILHSKEWILEYYVNTAYYGNRAYGPSAASLIYFGKPLEQLNKTEFTSLVNFPQNPSKTPKPVYTPALLSHTRHFLEWASRFKQNEQSIKTTLDLNLENKIEESLKKISAAKAQEDPFLNYAAIVIEVKTGNLIAMIGSRDYWNETINGQYNTALALRQPGSALKPFTYFAAFAKGYSPDTLIDDSPVSYGTPNENDVYEGYMPQNFDKRYHGTLTLGEALGNSLNVPAVKLLNTIGLSYYYELLQKFGFTTFDKNPAHYGLSLTLGSGEVSLLELTNAYATLARGGVFKPVKFLASQTDEKGVPVIDDAHLYASQVTQVLEDEKLRLKSFGFNEDLFFDGANVAVKTGTSTNQKDNWTLGYNKEYAVGVWMGHSDNTPLTTVASRGTGPLWHGIMEMLVERKKQNYTVATKENAPPVVNHIQEDAPFKITSPLPHSIYRKTSYLPDEPQKILARIQTSDIVPLRIYVDGEERVFSQTEKQASLWINPEVGVHTLTVATANYSQLIKFKVIE
ncbi:transglycosylase domain-containing protein [bacterium]|nr:transglycosylase domain-containing protein [bacterium]